VLELGELDAEVGHLAGAGHGLVQHRAAGQVAGVLTEVADGEAARTLDDAVVGLLLAGDEAEDGGLARPVGADEADLLAGVDLERRVEKEDLRAVLLADCGERDHVGRASSSCQRW
jgi:hypothetical protein